MVYWAEEGSNAKFLFVSQQTTKVVGVYVSSCV